MENNLGATLLESRPSVARRIVISLALLPIGAGLLHWSLSLAAICAGMIDQGSWTVPESATERSFFIALIFGCGMIFILLEWWILTYVVRFYERGVSVRRGFHLTSLRYTDIESVCAKISETRLAGLLPILRILELRFDPIEPTVFNAVTFRKKRIAINCFGLSKPVNLARDACAILETTGVHFDGPE